MCSNFWPCTDHPMDHGLNGHCLKGLCPWDRRPPPPPTRYISRLWAAITIQEYTRNWKDKQTHPVDCRATSPTRQERDSLKSQGRGWPRGPTWRLGISAGNAKPIPCSFISLLLLVGHCDRKECPVYYLSRVITGPGTRYSVVEGHCLTLVFVTQKLRHYFMSFTVHIVTRCDPIKHLMSRAILYS
uniref:Reverse transcriptase RNase H-like domain-containing protein n=1 Tax=Lactuca sativa TaxID=4236 RepID=A0A9R1WZN1_LACSA|nr:hypothetical protein LSAT_V11C800438170 [Lactuca sativa]